MAYSLCYIVYTKIIFQDIYLLIIIFCSCVDELAPKCKEKRYIELVIGQYFEMFNEVGWVELVGLLALAGSSIQMQLHTVPFKTNLDVDPVTFSLSAAT